MVECTIVETVVFKRSEREPVYLILRRSDSESLYPGMWQIVTGRIERGETATAASLRELQEETALRVQRFWTVPIVGSFYDPRNDSIQLCPLFAAETDPDAEPRLSEEHKEYVWAPLERARELLVWPGHHQAVDTVHQYITAGQEAARLTEINHVTLERKTL